MKSTARLIAESILYRCLIPFFVGWHLQGIFGLIPALIIVGVIGAFAILRLFWVHHQRLELCDGTGQIFRDYLTYEQMLWRFWIWDIEKLRKPSFTS